MARLMLLLIPLALAACETTQGFGRDIQTTGQVISQESAEVQSELR